MISTEEIQEKILTWVRTYLSPTFEFREHQLESITKIISNIINKTCENYIIEAPTGSGKSIICIVSAGVLARYYGLRSYILCSDLYLWEQYHRFIVNSHLDNFGFIKGQTGNYQCKQNKEDLRNAECRMRAIGWRTLMMPNAAKKAGYACALKCPYVLDRKRAISSDVCLMTYQLFLYMHNANSNSDSGFENREIIFCDECHNIPEIVQSKFSPIVCEKDFDVLELLYASGKIEHPRNKECRERPIEAVFDLYKKYENYSALKKKLKAMFKKMTIKESSHEQNFKCIDDYNNILKMFSPVVQMIEDNVSARKDSEKNNSEDDLVTYKQCSFFRNYMCHWNDFLTAIYATGDEYLVKDLSTDEDGKAYVSFNCIKEDYMVSHFLLNQADYRVMMSATVGGKSAFDENVGIQYTHSKTSVMDRIPSTFDFSKSPIFALTRYFMSYKTKETAFNGIKPIVYKLIEKFKDEHGLIQTGSYANARELYNDAPKAIQKRLLIYTNSAEKTKLLKTYAEDPGKIIIGPSLTEGIDLPDDLCRFIIILKVPYPSLTSELVKAKMKMFPRWYSSKTSNSIIQGIGRGNRNKTDYCQTFILDGCFKRLYEETLEQYSPEMQSRIKFYK